MAAATNFGFSIPDGATINGITVEWDQLATGKGTIGTPNCRLVKGGTIGSTSRGTAWGSGLVAYGGSSDLWGDSWSASDINGSNFGSVISVSVTGNSKVPQVDYCRITIDYTAAAAGQPTGRRLSQTQTIKTREIGRKGHVT